nr:immunoglobulin heavy chain junction region [Macaca mulatta]
CAKYLGGSWTLDYW